MGMKDKSFCYRGYTVYFKKDVAHWRAYANFNLEISGKTVPIRINEIGNTESKAIERAKNQINRQLNSLNPN